MFRVFAVTRKQAEAAARRKVKRTEGKGKTKREKTDAEYEADLEQEIAHQLRAAKPRPLSHDISTPAICREFMALIKPGDAGNLKIMYRADQGKRTKRGTKVLEWTEWKGGEHVPT